MISADPMADFYRHEQETDLSKYPVCSRCGEPIQTEFALRVDGIWICEECEKEMRVSVDDYFL